MPCTTPGWGSYESIDDVALARASFDKRVSDALEASGTVHMLGAPTPGQGSAGYVAIERVSGRLEGREGTFVLVHTGMMNRGARSLTVAVVLTLERAHLKDSRAKWRSKS